MKVGSIPLVCWKWFKYDRGRVSTAQFVTNIAVASRDNFNRNPFQNWTLPIYRHNFTHRVSIVCWVAGAGLGWGTKTEIISKIAGFVHVVFIGTLLFSLFRPAQLSVRHSTYTHIVLLSTI